jgi:hypothetical protein
MTGALNLTISFSNWTLDLSSADEFKRQANLALVKADFATRIGLRTDLTDCDRYTVLSLGNAILDSNFAKLQAMVISYRHYAEQFARIAYILASELRCQEVSVLKVNVMRWSAGSLDTEHKICVMTLKLDGGQRFIDIATDANYGVHVFAASGQGISTKLAKLNEDPTAVLKKIGTAEPAAPFSAA